jgi:hypothetical protein
MNWTKTILFQFENKSSKERLRVSMPYFPSEAINGFYSGIYKRLKQSFEPKNTFHFITGKKWFENKKTKRTVISLSSGIILDIPFEISKKDVKIINHHIDGVKMALKD